MQFLLGFLTALSLWVAHWHWYRGVGWYRVSLDLLQGALFVLAAWCL